MTTNHVAAAGGTPNKSRRPSLLQRIRHLPDEIKSHAKAIIGEEDHHRVDSLKEEDDPDIFTDVAFNPAKLLDVAPAKTDPSLNVSFKDVARKAVEATLHPRRTMREHATKTAAGVIGDAQQHYITIDHDKELLDAHDALSNATNHPTASPDDLNLAVDDGDISRLANARDRVMQVEEKRQSLQTAWVLGRHVDRVRVVRPWRMTKPQKSEFTHIDATGQERIAWEKWLAHVLLFYSQPFASRYIEHFDHPPFDIQDFARTVERLALTSAPWQAFLLDVRKVYMWDDPWRTARWAALFAVLWYTEHIVGYFYGYVIYSTIRNNLRTQSVESVREYVQRTINREAQARAWSEIIQQHGQNDWIEPLLDDVGPLIQLQLGDVADFLEVLINFHRHERPSKTKATLFFFAVCLTVTLVADMSFCVKLTWLVVGIGFFVIFPLATRFPQYRHVVLSLRWVFWDIPTHAELAIARLQESAIIRRAERLSAKEQRAVDLASTLPIDLKHPRLTTLHNLSRSSSTLSFQSIATNSSTSSSLSSPTSTTVPEEMYSFRVCRDDELSTSARLIITSEGIEYHESHSFKLLSTLTSNKNTSATALSSEQLTHTNPDEHQRKHIYIPFTALHEMRKLDVDSTRKKMASTVMLQSTSSVSALQFRHVLLSNSSETGHDNVSDIMPASFSDQIEPDPSMVKTLNLITSSSSRDKIFNLVLAWSGLKWQNLRMERWRGVVLDDDRNQDVREALSQGDNDTRNFKSTGDSRRPSKRVKDKLKSSGIGLDIHKSIKKALS